MKEKDGVSFAHEVKEEIARNERALDEERAFLSALLRENGRLRIGGDAPLAIELDSELAATAKAAYRAFRRLYGVRARFSYSRSTSLGGRTLFHVIAEEKVEEMLEDLEVDFLAPSFPEKVLRPKGAIPAYLSGAFLAGGSVNDPATPSYHLEIALRSEEFARFLRKLLNQRSGHPFQGKVIKRRGQHVLYLKKADQVSNFLILVGARHCCLRFENVRVDREFANYDNRIVNLDGANLRKSMRSGERYDPVRFELDYRQYKSVGERKVLAWTVQTKNVFGKNIPLNKYVLSGTPFDLRGYYMGQYRDKSSHVALVEYRQMFNTDRSNWLKRIIHHLGFVAWGGAGFMGPNPGKIEGVLPNAGLGLRIEVQPRMNVRLDFGRNFINRQNLFYFNMTEAF